MSDDDLTGAGFNLAAHWKLHLVPRFRADAVVIEWHRRANDGRWRSASEVQIRDATAADWASIWPFFREIVIAGETYTYDPALDAEQARALWMLAPPGRTVVAVAPDGTILGTAKMNPNQAGPGRHVASASFMVDPRHAGRGVGRALGHHALEWARSSGYRAMQFNAVVETNARAVALWRSLGFEVIGTAPEAFRHPTLGYVGLHVMYRAL